MKSIHILTGAVVVLASFQGVNVYRDLTTYGSEELAYDAVEFGPIKVR